MARYPEGVLVNTGDKLVLIDAGCGVDGKFQNTAGGLLGNLAAAGYAPGDIDMILFTHGHADHLWGISDRCCSPRPNSSPARPRSPSASPRLRLIKARAAMAPGVTTLDTAPSAVPSRRSSSRKGLPQHARVMTRIAFPFIAVLSESVDQGDGQVRGASL